MYMYIYMQTHKMNISKDVEKLNHLCIAFGNVKW